MPDDMYETRFGARGRLRIAGIDEVGRGPWAGPVVAAAVVLDPAAIPEGLDDSKKLSPNRREALYAQLFEAAEIGLGEATVEEIDRLNILQASFVAMRRAIDALPVPPGHLLIDGNRLPTGLPCPATPVVGGDGLSVSIAAASIVAKVARDRTMVTLAQQHPHYAWESNKGYGTTAHHVGLKSHGVTPHHRRSFKPIHKILYQEN